MADTSQPPLIAGLLVPGAYPHPVDSIELRETHISWVLLSGRFAYKIKKPVDLGFVDFTTLERRHFFCNEEQRLNGRFARNLYLDVVPITETEDGFRVSDEGEPVEYAVRMRRFDEQQLASRLLHDDHLPPADLDRLAVALAAFHESVPRTGDEPWGTAELIAGPVAENFSELRPLISDPPRLAQLDAIKDWSQQAAERLAPTFDQRRQAGFVRECHGDLHLGNIVRWQGALTPFDCIEFNPDFRWIDVMNEVAFLVMDLGDHGHSNCGWRFLNKYLEQTGDFAGLSVLPFYLVYRAMVRAKVDALRLRQTGLSKAEQLELTAEWHKYLDLAQRYTQPHQMSLTITCGVSGSGKTTVTQTLLERCGAIRLRSDVERKRLFRLPPTSGSAAAVDTGIYSQQATEQTYDRLAELAREVIASGFPVIVDATFLKRSQRRRFQELARECGVPFGIIPLHADERDLQERIRHRRSNEDEASDATREVLEHQLRKLEPLTDDERTFVTTRPGPDLV